jgi:diacylglycerol O-acyltransferase / wax synthase
LAGFAQLAASVARGPSTVKLARAALLEQQLTLPFAAPRTMLNVTLANNADNLDFGLVGCRRSVPHLQRLLGHLEDALKDLERAVGV